MRTMSPAIGLIEVESIARGIVCVDAVAKRAPIEFHVNEPVTPGKYVILFSGGVAEVEEAHAAGIGVAKDRLIDKLLLPQAHAQLGAGVAGRFRKTKIDSIGIIETSSIAAILLAADAACKTAPITLMSMRLAKGIGGKGYFTFTGELPDVEAALQRAVSLVSTPLLIGAEIIAAPHKQLDKSAL